MKEDKIIKTDKKLENDVKKPDKQGFLHTNPLLKKKFVANIINNKKKFSLKDLFR